MTEKKHTEEAITSEERAFLLGFLEYEDYENLFIKGLWYCKKKDIYNEKICKKISLLHDMLSKQLMYDLNKYDEIGTEKVSMIENIIEKLNTIIYQHSSKR